FQPSYYPGPTNGILPAGSILTSGNRKFPMPPDYHVNDVLMIGHNNGGRRPLIPAGTLTFTTPAAFSGLSILVAAGNGPVILGWTVHYADSTSESGAPATVPDWFLNPAPASPVWNSSGRISMGGALQHLDQAAPAGGVLGM